MIKTFEQFVSTVYGRSVNEAFQSGKLRNIIKQHGMPKWNFEKKMLYDIKDDEIIDVVNNRNEYYSKYPSYDREEGEQETFILELEDGVCVVIGNLGILKKYFDTWGDKSKKEKDDLFKKRHSERHVGNQGKGGMLDIRRKHLENVNKILKRRLAEKLQEYIPEIVEKIKSEFSDIDYAEAFDSKETTIEFETSLGDDEYTICLNCDLDRSDTWEDYGAEFCNIYYSLRSFEIYSEDAGIDNVELGVTPKTHADLFKNHVEKDVECGIVDHYKYYGVSPSDFF